MATMSLPSISGSRASCKAAQTLAPEEMPQRMPSSLARARAVQGPQAQGLEGSARRILKRPGSDCVELSLEQFDRATAAWFMLEAHGPIWWPAP